jgi:hypothetical protein
MLVMEKKKVWTVEDLQVLDCSTQPIWLYRCAETTLILTPSARNHHRALQLRSSADLVGQ